MLDLVDRWWVVAMAAALATIGIMVCVWFWPTNWWTWALLAGGFVFVVVMFFNPRWRRWRFATGMAAIGISAEAVPSICVALSMEDATVKIVSSASPFVALVCVILAVFAMWLDARRDDPSISMWALTPLLLPLALAVGLNGIRQFDAQETSSTHDQSIHNSTTTVTDSPGAATGNAGRDIIINNFSVSPSPEDGGLSDDPTRPLADEVPPTLPGSDPSMDIIPQEDRLTHEDIGSLDIIEDPRAKGIVFAYKNTSSRDLTLFLFDCDRDSRNQHPWTKLAFQSTNQPYHRTRFHTGTGWFCLVVRDDEGTPTYLGRYNLFESSKKLELAQNEQGELVWTVSPLTIETSGENQ